MEHPARRRTPHPAEERDAADPAPDAAHDSAPGADTRQRLLDVAERLFAEQSYEATSLRQLTTAAGANLAAVHYHFGSKEGLFRAVFARRAGPINAARLERLADLGARGGTPTIEELLDALIEPALRLYADAEWRWFMRLVGRAFSEPGEHWLEADREFEEVRAAFGAAFARALPDLDGETLAVRLFLTLGVQCVVLSVGHAPKRASPGCVGTGDTQKLLGELVAYAAAGLRAPSAHGDRRASSAGTSG